MYKANKLSVTTLNLGGITENFEFKMDEDTEVYESCSATLKGELFVFGGTSSTNNRKKQVFIRNQYSNPHEIIFKIRILGFKSNRLRAEAHRRFEL